MKTIITERKWWETPIMPLQSRVRDPEKEGWSLMLLIASMIYLNQLANKQGSKSATMMKSSGTSGGWME
jgi:hypothetical protein